MVRHGHLSVSLSVSDDEDAIRDDDQRRRCCERSREERCAKTRRRASEDDDDDGDAIRVRHRAGTGGVPRPPRVNRSSGWLGFRPFAANDRRRTDRTATDGDGPGDGCADGDGRRAEKGD